jgi:hypothetical protein
MNPSDIGNHKLKIAQISFLCTSLSNVPKSIANLSDEITDATFTVVELRVKLNELVNGIPL